MSQSDSENDLWHAAAAAAERDAGLLTAAAARKRARADAGGDGGSTGERVRSPEMNGRAAARSRKRRVSRQGCQGLTTGFKSHPEKDPHSQASLAPRQDRQ